MISTVVQKESISSYLSRLEQLRNG